MGHIRNELWGLHLEPGKVYSRRIRVPFQVSMAALGKNLCGKGRTSVMVGVDDTEYTLCSLIPNRIEQHQLDHMFAIGEKITFYVHGPNPVDLTGNFVTLSDEYEEGVPEDIDSEDSEEVSDEEEDEADSSMDDFIDDGYDSSEEEVEEVAEVEEEPRRSKKRSSNKADAEKKDRENAVEGDKKDKKHSSSKSRKKTDTDKKAKEKTPESFIIESVKESSKEGVSTAKNGDSVSMTYKLYVIDDSGNKTRKCSGIGLSMVLGSNDNIGAFDKTVLGMSIGSVRRLTIDTRLYTGDGMVFPGSPSLSVNPTLVYEIKLEKIEG